MGIDANGAGFLAYARGLGVEFSRTLTIGRQNLYVTPQRLCKVLTSFGVQPSEAELALVFEGGGRSYSENLFHYLGAEEADSLDYSDYQNATHIHDMNSPIPDALKERYTVVVDGGSLEHVFNFPVALKNCMEMVRVGGHYLAITPANNFFGHGFYQFSPETYYTVFTAENGFEVVRLIAFEDVEKPAWHLVKRPSEVAGRVTLCNAEPVYLFLIARRTARVPIFRTQPQQSDYTAIWAACRASREVMPATSTAPARRPLAIRFAKAILPANFRLRLRKAMQRPQKRVTGFDARFFSRIDPLADRHVVVADGRPCQASQQESANHV